MLHSDVSIHTMIDVSDRANWGHPSMLDSKWTQPTKFVALPAFAFALCDLSFGFGLFVLLPIVDAMPAFEFALQGVLSASHMRNAPDI